MLKISKTAKRLVDEPKFHLLPMPLLLATPTLADGWCCWLSAYLGRAVIVRWGWLHDTEVRLFFQD
jgi:hypothetical protein